MSQALIVSRPGGREVLEVMDRPRPEPGPGEALVEVAAAGVNFIDVYQREGVYPMPTPFVLGMEGAGVVTALGPGVDGLAVGDRVAWAMVNGAAAQHASVPVNRLVPVPPGVDLRLAAASMLQGMTAHFLATSAFPTGLGMTALVHAAAGGVGQLLVQMLKLRGVRVVATAGGPQKCATARARGADHVIDYRGVPDLAAAIREVAPEGVDVVYDGVGKDTFDASLASLRPRGLLVVFGAASGPVPPFDIQRLNTGGSLYVTRPTLGNYIATRSELLDRAQAVFAAIEEGVLDISIGGRYRLDEAPAAYEALEGRHTQGKLLLIP